MRRIIVILLLSVFVIAQSGCDKIKAELERRHLGKQTQTQEQKEPSSSTPQTQKTPDDALNSDETSSKRKQIVLRIDLPTDEKIQIRLIKNTPSEEIKTDSPDPSASNSTESKPKAEFETNKLETKDDNQENKSEKQKLSVEEESVGAIKTHLDQQQGKAEKQDSSNEQSRSETKMDREERSPAIEPASTPTIVVPSSRMPLPPDPLDGQEKKELTRQETAEMAPAEKAVGSALSITPLETTLPVSKERLNGTLPSKETSDANPWAIPNADYPLRY